MLLTDCISQIGDQFNNVDLWDEFVFSLQAVYKVSSVWKLSAWTLAHHLMYFERAICVAAGKRERIMANTKEEWIASARPYYERLLKHYTGD